MTKGLPYHDTGFHHFNAPVKHPDFSFGFSAINEIALSLNEKLTGCQILKTVGNWIPHPPKKE